MDKGVRRCSPKAITKGNVEILPLFKGLTMCNDLLCVKKKWWAFMKCIQVAQKSKMTSHVSRESYGFKAPSQYIKKSLICHYICQND
jgi:hypothetical protein